MDTNKTLKIIVESADNTDEVLNAQELADLFEGADDDGVHSIDDLDENSVIV